MAFILDLRLSTLVNHTHSYIVFIPSSISIKGMLLSLNGLFPPGKMALLGTTEEFSVKITRKKSNRFLCIILAYILVDIDTDNNRKRKIQ